MIDFEIEQPIPPVKHQARIYLVDDNLRVYLMVNGIKILHISKNSGEITAGQLDQKQVSSLEELGFNSFIKSDLWAVSAVTMNQNI